MPIVCSGPNGVNVRPKKSVYQGVTKWAISLCPMWKSPSGFKFKMTKLKEVQVKRGSYLPMVYVEVEDAEELVKAIGEVTQSILDGTAVDDSDGGGQAPPPGRDTVPF
jgi:hypothetical protein